jgi:hypothetical protein
MRTSKIDIILEYWPLPHPEALNVNIIAINGDIIQQSKVKENERIFVDVVDNIAEPNLFGNDKNEKLDYEKLVMFFNGKTKGVFGTIRLPLNENRKKHIKACIRECWNDIVRRNDKCCHAKRLFKRR